MRATEWTSVNWPPQSQWKTWPTAWRDKGIIRSTLRSLVSSRGDYAASLTETQTTSTNSSPQVRKISSSTFCDFSRTHFFTSPFHPPSSTTLHSLLSSAHPFTLHRRVHGCRGEGWRASNVRNQKKENISFSKTHLWNTQKKPSKVSLSSCLLFPTNACTDCNSGSASL